LNSKQINGGTGIGLAVYDGQCNSQLYLPERVTPEDEAYIAFGEAQGVNNKYKCQQRKPWYITPGVEVPDLILSVFGDVPKMIINRGKYSITNSLLNISLKSGVSSKELICRWYNSLTLLSIELNVHSLGGGSLVMIPGEADALKIVSSLPIDKIEPVFNALDKCVLQKGVQAAYRLGDELVLKQILGLSASQILTIQNAVEALRKWRLPKGRRDL
jgi:hypothetical protein